MPLKAKTIMNHSVYESAHSRKLTSKTFNDSRFRLDFISTIVGISKENFETFEKTIMTLNKSGKCITLSEELKSALIRSKEYKFGLASFLSQRVIAKA